MPLATFALAGPGMSIFQGFTLRSPLIELPEPPAVHTEDFRPRFPARYGLIGLWSSFLFSVAYT